LLFFHDRKLLSDTQQVVSNLQTTLETNKLTDYEGEMRSGL